MTDSAWRVRDGTVFRELDGEAVVLNLETGTYFGLNRVGTTIWQLVEEDGRVSAVVDGVTRLYDVTRERAQADVMTLTARLIEKGLIERVP